jgi:hypothetical protein
MNPAGRLIIHKAPRKATFLSKFFLIDNFEFFAAKVSDKQRAGYGPTVTIYYFSMVNLAKNRRIYGPA